MKNTWILCLLVCLFLPSCSNESNNKSEHIYNCKIAWKDSNGEMNTAGTGEFPVAGPGGVYSCKKIIDGKIYYGSGSLKERDFESDGETGEPKGNVHIYYQIYFRGEISEGYEIMDMYIQSKIKLRFSFRGVNNEHINLKNIETGKVCQVPAIIEPGDYHFEAKKIIN